MKLTVPDGVVGDCGVWVWLTVAVHVVEVLSATLDAVQLTDVDVAYGGQVIVTDAVDEVAPLLSPADPWSGAFADWCS